ELDRYLAESGDAFRLIEFSGPDCSACRLVQGVLESLEAEFEGVLAIAKLEIDEQSDIGLRFGIRSVPTLILFKNGRPVRRGPGTPSRAAVRAFIADGIASSS